MRQNNIFTKARREAPSDETAKGAQLLIRSGYIHKEMAGVYDLLFLGVRVMNKLEGIIRAEMEKAGGQEIHMSSLQEASIWKKTDRWDDKKVDNWFKTKLKNDNEVGLGSTHEEPITNMLKNHVNSYKDLPIYVYQFQTKFRNELRAKSGMMRGREFLMKDLYSFSIDEEQHNIFYEKMKKAYMNIFNQVGIGDITFITFASGSTFSKYSHEFQTVSDVGEDTIYLDREKNLAVNDEIASVEILEELNMEKEKLEKLKTVEVGNIFSLSDKFSKPFELLIDKPDGQRVPVYMGCYGIGVGRLMSTVVDALADEKGLVWPLLIAPFECHLVNLISDSSKADQIYDLLKKNNVDVLYDDRDLSAGQKLNESDLLGIPYRVVVGKKCIENNELEFCVRKTGEIKMVKEKDILNFVEGVLNGDDL